MTDFLFFYVIDRELWVAHKMHQPCRKTYKFGCMPTSIKELQWILLWIDVLSSPPHLLLISIFFSAWRSSGVRLTAGTKACSCDGLCWVVGASGSPRGGWYGALQWSWWMGRIKVLCLHCACTADPLHQWLLCMHGGVDSLTCVQRHMGLCCSVWGHFLIAKLRSKDFANLLECRFTCKARQVSFVPVAHFIPKSKAVIS